MGPIRMHRSTRRGLNALVLAMLFISLLTLTASSLEAQTRLGIELGNEPAPFALETVDGELVDLADVIGHRPVLIEFWATWCPKCERLHPKMVAAHKAFGDRVEFYGIAVAMGQKPSSIRKHLKKHPLPFPMLWDADGHAVRQFMVPVTSYVVILDANGRVAYTGVDSTQDISGALSRIVGESQSESESS